MTEGHKPHTVIIVPCFIPNIDVGHPHIKIFFTVLITVALTFDGCFLVGLYRKGLVYMDVPIADNDYIIGMFYIHTDR